MIKILNKIKDNLFMRSYYACFYPPECFGDPKTLRLKMLKCKELIDRYNKKIEILKSTNGYGI